MRRIPPISRSELIVRLKKCIKSPVLIISAAGVAVAVGLFLNWLNETPQFGLAERSSALLSVFLFVLICLKFVPEWMRFWRFSPGRPSFRPDRTESPPEQRRLLNTRIFLKLFLLNFLVLAAAFFLRRLIGYQETFLSYLDFWRCTDSGSYLNIAKDWYPTEGETVVQLVFLPGYPVAVRLFNLIFKNELLSGLLVSALSFPAAGCVLYHLLRLDHSHGDALRAIRYLCLFPGLFFYTAPMSESLFLLLTVSCLYCCRTRKWFLGCLIGGYAAFTRSLGVTLLVPLVTELIRAIRVRPASCRASNRKWSLRALSLLLVAAGLGAYLVVNYQVSGDPLKFQEYQLNHWGQQLGLFFNTAAYQTYQAIRSSHSNLHTFFGLWLPNIVACFTALTLIFLSVRQMRPSYIAWFIAYYFVAIGTTWLLSAPRYLMVLFTTPLSLAVLTKKRSSDLILSSLCVALSILYFYAFVMRWQVW